MDPVAFARRITTFPATLQTTTRERIARGLEQLRVALDLPSRKELAELTQRLEALDARIASLAAQRVAEIGRAVPTLPEAEMAEAAPETEAADDAETPADAAVEAGASDRAETVAETAGAKKKPLKNRR